VSNDGSVAINNLLAWSQMIAHQFRPLQESEKYGLLRNGYTIASKIKNPETKKLTFFMTLWHQTRRQQDAENSQNDFQQKLSSD
jgi:hypothetical protein